MHWDGTYLYYKQAQIVRTKLIKEFDTVFDDVDLLLGPTAPVTAFKIGQKDKHDPLSMYLMDMMTVSANLTGSPAISIPAGVSESLPVGLQIIAAQRQDRYLLSFANESERLLK